MDVEKTRSVLSKLAVRCEDVRGGINLSRNLNVLFQFQEPIPHAKKKKKVDSNLQISMKSEYINYDVKVKLLL